LRPALAVAAALWLGLAACGGDDDTTTSSVAGSDGSAVDAVDTVDTVADTGTVAPGGASDETAGSSGGRGDGAPTVSVPDEIPTELVISTLTEGNGTEAAEGDTVIVDYIGVLTRDGTRFDSSYDGARQPFVVTLGSGGVIPGWEQGLVGVRVGERRQLDIPSDLAYGDSPPPDSPIQAGDALTFVVDVRAVIAPTNPDDAPTDLEIPASTGASELDITEVVVGEGATATIGSTAIVNVLLYEGASRSLITNSWEASQPLQVAMDPEQTLPGIVGSIEGMKVGGRRLVVVPADQAFGAEGSANLGVAPDTDLVLVVDLLAAF
jgi:peptidylprolyl isomerase